MFLLSIFAAAAACFIIGFLMHGPILGKLWMKLADIHPTGNEKFSDMYGKMAWNFVANIVTSFVVYCIAQFVLKAKLLNSLEGFVDRTTAIESGIIASLLIWLVIAAGSSMEVIWMGKKWKLWMFEILTSLICFVVMGIIIGAMM